MLNSCNFIGHVGQIDIKQTKDGKDIANISLGVSESWKDKSSGERKSKTEWVRIVAFGGTATFAKNYISKGSKLFVNGQMQTRKWTDKEGNDKYSTEIVVQNFKGQIQNLSPREETQEDKAWKKAEQNHDDALPDDNIPF